MSQTYRRGLWPGLILSVLTGGLLLGAAHAAEQSLKELIVGTWKLASIYNEKDGAQRDIFGSNPMGIYTFDRNGNFSQVIVRSELPKFISNSREKGTSDENRAVVQGSIANFGTYSVGEGNLIALKIEGSTYPNRTGTTETRTCTILGDEMKVTDPKPSTGAGTTYTTWKRAP